MQGWRRMKPKEFRDYVGSLSHSDYRAKVKIRMIGGEPAWENAAGEWFRFGSNTKVR